MAKAKKNSLAVLDLITDDQLVNELVRRGWTLRRSTTGRYLRAVIEDCKSEFLKGQS